MNWLVERERLPLVILVQSQLVFFQNEQEAFKHQKLLYLRGLDILRYHPSLHVELQEQLALGGQVETLAIEVDLIIGLVYAIGDGARFEIEQGELLFANQ